MQNRQLTTTDNTMAVVRRETAALEKLYPDQRKIIEAALQPALLKLEVMNVLERLTDTVNMAYSICGQKPDMETIAITVNELYTKLMEIYPHCTMEEVRTAIRNGVFDEYGEYFGLNVKTFVMFIRAYLFSERRKAARIAFEAARREAETPKSEPYRYWEDSYWTEERIDQWRRITESSYKWFCENSILSGFIQEGCYWLLKRSGAITMSDGYKTELITRAKHTMRTELIRNEEKKHISEIKNTLERLQNADDHPDLIRQIHFKAKRLAVLDYFVVLQKKEKTMVFTENETIE